MEVGSVQNVGHVTARLMKCPQNLYACQRRALGFVDGGDFKGKSKGCWIDQFLVPILCKEENTRFQEGDGQQDR